MEELSRGNYLLTSDPERVDLEKVHGWLAEETPWARGRERDVVARSIQGSRCYSILHSKQQVAFARVVTDGVTFAWICDVFVARAHRGRGLATWLIDTLVEDLSRAGVAWFLLVTSDAHAVYERSGFARLQGVDRWMELDRRV